MGPQPGHKRQASRTIVLIPFPEQVGPTPSPLLARLGGFLLALPGCVKQKAWNGGLSKRGKEKGGVVSLSLSPTPPLLQRQPLSLAQRKGIYLQKKSPLDMKRSGLWPGKAKRSPQRGSGPVHFNSCTFMEDHKKGPSLALGLGLGGGGHGGD